MTEQELREKIQRVLLQYMSAIHAELIHSHDDVFLTDKILALIKEAGYVQLADDHSLPISPYTYYSKRDRTKQEETETYCDIGYSRAIGDIKRANWRKVRKEIKDDTLP